MASPAEFKLPAPRERPLPRRVPRSGGDDDAAVQSTNDDAQISKLSAVNQGYLADDYVRYFVTRPARRSPMMNRGYYVRVVAIDHIIRQFLLAPLAQEQRQIICLGSGYDTRFFQLASTLKSRLHRYVDVDFATVTGIKVRTILETPALRTAAGVPEGDAVTTKTTTGDPGTLRTNCYNIVPCDLRDLDRLEARLVDAGVDFSIPTLLLSECVLVYLDGSQSDALVAWASRRFPQSVFLCYENINPDDAFGEMMVRNFEARGIPLLGLRAHPTVASQRQRFLSNGFSASYAMTLRTIHDTCIDAAEALRLRSLELFDEFEDWNLLMEHYCIAVGAQGQQELIDALCLVPSCLSTPAGVSPTPKARRMPVAD